MIQKKSMKPSQTSLQTSVDAFMINEDVTRAKNYHTIDCVTGHLSYNSRKHSSALFSVMFPECEVAQKFSWGPSKLSYFAVFGLAPYLVDDLYSKLDKLKFYSVSFDESFNSFRFFGAHHC